MTNDLADKVALVTGSSKGVGKGIALELARHGASIVVNYNSDEQGAKDAAAEIEKLGAHSMIVGASVGRKDDIERMFADVDKQFGRIDILVNNAGVQAWKELTEVTEDDWDRVIDTNLKGSFLCTQQAARRMKTTGGGRIVHIGSGCNKIAFPRLVSYTASKGGLDQFTKVAAVELGKFNITVNCVAPGSIEVERTKEESGDYAGTWSKLTPLGRIGTPADIGKAVYFFASPYADFITGQTLFVDGGLFAKPHWPYEI